MWSLPAFAKRQTVGFASLTSMHMAPSLSCLAALILSSPQWGQQLGEEQGPQMTLLLVSVWPVSVSVCKHLGCKLLWGGMCKSMCMWWVHLHTFACTYTGLGGVCVHANVSKEICTCAYVCATVGIGLHLRPDKVPAHLLPHTLITTAVKQAENTQNKTPQKILCELDFLPGSHHQNQFQIHGLPRLKQVIYQQGNCTLSVHRIVPVYLLSQKMPWHWPG